MLPACAPKVNGRIIRKRIHVRIEHIQPSRCREDFLRRRETNDKIKHEAKVKGGEARAACDLGGGGSGGARGLCTVEAGRGAAGNQRDT